MDKRESAEYVAQLESALEAAQKRADGYMNALREEGMNFGMAMPTPEEFVFALKGLMVVFARNARKEAEMELSRMQHTMKWTTEQPTQDGYYFVHHVWSWEASIHCVRVGIDAKGKITFHFPVGGYECEDEIDSDHVTHWMGPIEEPAPPVMLEHSDNAYKVIPQT